MRPRSKLGSSLRTLLGFALALLAPSSLAQHPEPTTLETWPQTGFDITISREANDITPSVTAQQLEVRENGSPAKFEIVPAGAEPQSVCILVDTSGSTYQDRKIIQQTVSGLVTELPPQDELCLVDFNTKSYIDARLTFSRPDVQNGVQLMRVGGGSAIYDALADTSNYLQKSARFRSRLIILVSDGSDNASNHGIELKDALHAPGAPVLYAIYPHSSHNSDLSAREAGRSRKTLIQLTGETGGLAWFPTSDPDVMASVTNLVQTLNRRYRLILTTATSPDGLMHHLDITLNKDLQKQKFMVHATRGYDAALP